MDMACNVATHYQSIHIIIQIVCVFDIVYPYFGVLNMLE